MATSTKGEDESVTDRIIVTSLLRRRGSILFFSYYTIDHTMFKIKHNGDGVIEFRDGEMSRVKYTYEMKNCAGVYLRTELDYGKVDWPDDAEKDCCIIIEDRDTKNCVYLIANEARIASHWKNKLDQYLCSKTQIIHNETLDEYENEFSIDDLSCVQKILRDPQNFPPDKWKLLGRALGLADVTIQTIEECFLPNGDECCVTETLSLWYATNGVGPKESTMYACLTNALNSIGEGRAGELISMGNQSHNDLSSSTQDDLDVNEDSLPMQNHDHQATFAESFTLSRRSSVSTATRNRSGTLMAIFGEMTGFSNKKRSSHLKIINKTNRSLTFNKCFIVKGRPSRHIQSNEVIYQNDQSRYSFEKYTDMSLEGCAAVLVFTTELPNSPNKCCFLIAFRNNCIQFTKRSRNKAVVLLLNDLNVANEIDSVYFGTIMRNEDPKPSSYELPGSYKGDEFGRTFMSVYTNEDGKDDFGSIAFSLSMHGDLNSLITLQVLPGEEELRDLQPG